MKNDFLEDLFKRKGGIKLGLGRIESAFPLILEKQLPVYHVAGTNGKGTTVYAISHILEKNGMKTGRFISPHLYDYNERIAVNGINISDLEIKDLYSHIERTVPDFDELSFFEITFLIAWKHFEISNCDRVVIEVGLGGRLDATNVMNWTKTDIITSIGHDHTHILGDTLDKIAKEKLGIVKKGDIVILGQNNTVGAKDFSPLLHGFDAWMASEAVSRGASLVLNEFSYDLEHINDINLSDDQKRNIRLACCAVSSTEKNAVIPEFSSLKLPGRFQEISPGIIIDVAHNPPAILSLVEFIKQKGEKVVVLYGAMKDKDIEKVTQYLSEIAVAIFVISLDAENRGANAGEITERTHGKAGNLLRVSDNDEKTIENAIRFSRENGVDLLVTGSFHTIEKFVRSKSYGSQVK